MALKSVLGMWEDYLATLPADTSTLQRWQARRAFYAGFHATLMQHLAARAELTPPALGGLLASLEEECRVFLKDVAAGRA